MITKKLVHQNSVVLVSGGARGITASCVVKLAERAHCKFILLGRSSAEMPPVDFDPEGCDEPELKRRIAGDLAAKGEKPAPARIQKIFSGIRSSQEIHETLQAVENAGGCAEYVRVDVADPNLPERLAGPVQRLGAISGIIHGAGALVDKLIEKKTESDFETVYTPKVTGLENMLCSVDVARLDFLVLFSSIVGFYGNVGQSDYAIANEILNKSAYMIKRRYPDCHVISINWGPWDSGMVTPELKKIFEARNVEVIPTDVGARMLVEALMPGVNETSEAIQVVVGGVPVRPAARVDAGLRSYQIMRRLTVDENPFLYDHMIGEHAVLPATCAAAWVAYSCEQLYPGYHFFCLENYRVLKGIVFDDNLAGEHVLELKEVAKSEEKIVFDALIWSKNKKDRQIYHYSLRVTLMRDLPTPPVFAVENAVGDGSISGSQLYHDGTLFHGPAFQGVERVLHLSRGKLVMQVVLPHMEDRIQGQFPAYTANPFIYDAIVQCLLIWAQYFYQAPCLPSSLRKLEQFMPIPFGVPSTVTMEVESQSATSVVGNILVQDGQGSTYIRLDGLEGTISPYLNRFIGKKETA
ncbi:MAG: KR domain-containing protein [Chloroflexi bacterium]|nr:MAG: KR domain-containing protein [Chloroflexota bacterium]